MKISKRSKDQKETFYIRISPQLKQNISELAAKNNISVNLYITYLLETECIRSQPNIGRVTIKKLAA